MKKITPRPIAMPPIMWTNLAISSESGVGLATADIERLAILPITVSSPVLMTTPVPEPNVHIVPKKATFGLSKMFGTFTSTFLNKSSDSPVNDALFTFISEAAIKTISAGTLSPP